ncbi:MULTISPECIES: IND family subclass B1 metallo-beta-lactamase [unclassified Chryseobacterium]|uniref:IND family subclass B1 metallo-beta-lactamase n=1 Tax=unclassified Chryseobacterium TaxID=2593645 RepID=UPI000D71052F|nr:MULTISPECIES: IND family subclass B1 metallo-beta-lactamase [unclassified Chryseobacterium]PWW16957.1 metallo-beta-lactamase class B/metallo-beta-lactamase class B IND [Chryseobacterium sp. AG844]
MKKSIPFFIISMLLSPLASAQNTQVRDFVIEPQIQPNFYIYKTFGVFGGKEYSTNAVYLVTKKGVVLFDVPWQKTQYQSLMDTIQKRHSLPLIAVFATHSHEDRAGDLSFYNKKGIKTYATAKTNELLKKDGKATSTELIKTGKPYRIGGEEFIVDFLGEGHTADNVVVWFPKYKILDGGCLVKSKAAVDLGYTGEANVAEWPKTMTKLKNKYSQATLIIPGHDEWKGGGHVEHTLDLLNKK